jgi:hypothetical protein
LPAAKNTISENTPDHRDSGTDNHNLVPRAFLFLPMTKKKSPGNEVEGPRLEYKFKVI